MTIRSIIHSTDLLRDIEVRLAGRPYLDIFPSTITPGVVHVGMNGEHGDRVNFALSRRCSADASTERVIVNGFISIAPTECRHAEPRLFPTTTEAISYVEHAVEALKPKFPKLFVRSALGCLDFECVEDGLYEATSGSETIEVKIIHGLNGPECILARKQDGHFNGVLSARICVEEQRHALNDVDCILASLQRMASCKAYQEPSPDTENNSLRR